MAEAQDEDSHEAYQSYPYQQPVVPEIVPAEPTNAELEATRPARPGTNWVVLFRVIALWVLLILIVFWIFPPDTWQFEFNP